jgi:hypothetical protein
MAFSLLYRIYRTNLRTLIEMTETTEMIEMSSISVQFFGGENISRFEYIYEYIYLKLQSSIFADFKDKYLKNSFHSEIQYLHISDLI